jgi:hypothetical protein
MRPGEMVTPPHTMHSDSSSVKPTERCVILTPKWFAFVVRAALSHACRHADYLTLVTIRASREYVGSTIDVGAQALTEVADIIDPTIRAADMVGQLDDGQLGILLSDTDEEAAARIIRRVAERLAHVRFTAPLTFAIGAGSCPAHGVHAADLVAHAMTHPLLDVRSGSALVADPCAC